LNARFAAVAPGVSTLHFANGAFYEFPIETEIPAAWSDGKVKVY
jgi:hypothetical protein